MTKAFVIGGENLVAESLRLWRDFAPDTRLINEYGPTETVVGCCVYEVKAGDPCNGSVPIGRPTSRTPNSTCSTGTCSPCRPASWGNST